MHCWALLTRTEQVFVAGHVVADDVVGLPAAEERETRTQLQFDTVVGFAQVGSGNVADLVAVVDVAGRQRQQCLHAQNRHMLISGFTLG